MIPESSALNSACDINGALTSDIDVTTVTSWLGDKPNIRTVVSSSNNAGFGLITIIGFTAEHLSSVNAEPQVTELFDSVCVCEIKTFLIIGYRDTGSEGAQIADHCVMFHEQTLVFAKHTPFVDTMYARVSRI